MIIYDDVKKNTKIAIFSEQIDILKDVADLLINEDFKIEEYNEEDKLFKNIQKIKIVILINCNIDIIRKIRQKNNKIIIIAVCNKIKKYSKAIRTELNIQNITDIDDINFELMRYLHLIYQEEKVKFQNFKSDIVSSLVESISNQVQSNLLIVGASLDVIKMIAEDNKLKESEEKKDVLENLYQKNNNALQKANMLLQLMSDATSISSESIMQYEDVVTLIKLILNEYIKVNNVDLNIEVKIKKGTYICGPLNDIIFILCNTIKQIASKGNNRINLCIKEDENKWYFVINIDNTDFDKDSIRSLNNYFMYLEDVQVKVTQKNIIIEIKKIK